MSHNLWRIAHNQELAIRRPLVMGIVNVTPDSFSDGGQFYDPTAAIAHGMELVYQGADILDIGGESTRPGAEPVPLEEELKRVWPVVSGLAAQTHVPISIDTSKAEVARQCIEAGAAIINDVTALTGDPAMLDVARATRAGVVLMHMPGTPQTMNDNAVYADVVAEVYEYLEVRMREVTWAGLPAEQIVLDPGIGFGKLHGHSLQLIAGLDTFQRLGRPVCLGVSRKGFIGHTTGRPRGERMAGSLAVACYAMARRAAQVLRVHDVGPTVDAVKMIHAIEGGT